MRHEFTTFHCNSSGAFRLAGPPPANSNSWARMLKWFAANDKAVQAETDQYCKQYGKLTRKRLACVSCGAGV